MYRPVGVIGWLLMAAVINTNEAIVIICIDCRLARELLGIHENA